MHVAVRGARPQLSLRALLMLGGATLMVIVGLLAMHTFTSEPAGHGSVGLTHSAAGEEHATVAASTVASESTACEGACHVNTGHGQGHNEMLIACVLALLAGLLLLLPPILIQRHRLPPHRAVSLVRWEAIGILPRAPSLTFLSISRT
ncbi:MULTISPECIES: DUF6153 family protein [Microbacterium]|uniref:DUF6153 family protein n=2 Tax=Microbacterium TaxID=33882 RepID=A0ABU8LV08_9MICO|nr:MULTISPECIES: DUF6153 family protein [Microbacterium]MBD8011187.1 hypothetical protein [Microbacterium commune]MDN5544588.1 DUF6153 family protein [Rhodococcus sp. (in: high G+C Gram-positive bacteria)]